MTDSVSISNMPDGGSRERVAYDLTTYILRMNPNTPKTEQNVLDLYVKCLSATLGHRS